MSNNSSNEELFNIFNPNENFNFSSLSADEKKNFLCLLKNYLIEYRNTLNIDNDISFGIEIEVEDIYAGDIEPGIKKHIDKGWYFQYEPSLKNGCEIVSPILFNNKESFKDIKNMCQTIKKFGGIIKDTCGGHIHIGSNILENNALYWQNFLRLCCAYENVIMHYSSNDYRKLRKDYLYFAIPFYLYFKKIYNESIENNCLPNQTEEFKKKNLKEFGISLYSVKWNIIPSQNSTVEIRIPNGTIDEIIWQNNINFFCSLLMYSTNDNYNTSFLLNKFNKSHPNSFCGFEKIDYEEPFELADLIFKKNIDKINFLKQYYKDFLPVDDNIEEQDMQKVKCFTKSM